MNPPTYPTRSTMGFKKNFPSQSHRNPGLLPIQIRSVIAVGAAQHAMPAPAADRMQVVVLRMPCGTKPRVRILAAGAPLTVPPAGPLRKPRLLFRQRGNVANRTLFGPRLP